MRKKTIILSIMLGMFTLFAQAKNEVPIYKDPKQNTEARIQDLLKRMTLDEKVMQLNQYTLGRNDNANNMADPINDIPAEIGSLIYFSSDPALRNRLQKKAMEQTRLGIPVLFGYDVIHGYRTVYPISIAQACSWNLDLVKQACQVAAQEARMSGVDWTFSPMVDVARDPRWGRVAEGYGEDTYTNAMFGVASIQGYQGDDIAGSKNVAACLKHFVGYGASEAGRDYVYTEISNQTLWDTYLKPFEEGVKAGAATAMSSFNDISGTPASANAYILRDILKGKWQHDGFVVSDWGAIQQLRSQRVAKDNKEAAMKAFNAGVEMDMMNSAYDKNLANLVNEGKVSEELLNDAVERVLRVKFRLGLFENPYTPTSTEKERFLLPQSLKIAEQLAEESIVLLKNEDKILPLNDATKIAVVGPMAQSKWHLLGSWRAHGNTDDVVSIYEGLEKEFASKAQLSYAMGCDFDGEDRSTFDEAIAKAKDADVIVVCLGEKAQWSGENASRSTIALPQIQEDLVTELSKLNKPIVLLLSSGRPLELTRLEKQSNAMLQIWQPGILGAYPIAGILRGRINPSGKLAITFPYATGQIPIYYNHRQSGRLHQGKYQDIPSTPLYDFGYGLSYTDYNYGDISAPKTSIKRGEKLTVEVAVANTGDMDGLETVHWFVSDPVSTISRPVKELKHFEKKQIQKGESQTFQFVIDPEKDLAFVDGTGEKVLESGEYIIQVKDKQLSIHLID